MFHPEILTGSQSVGVKQGRGWVNKPFYSFKRQYPANGRRHVQTAKLGYY